MDINKVFFVTDENDFYNSTKLLNTIISTNNLRIGELISLQISTSDEWLKKLTNSEIKKRVYVEDRLLSSNILTHANKEEASLIIINFTNRMNNRFRNNIIRQLIRKSSIPILFSKTLYQLRDLNEKGIFKHAVFSTDLNEVSENALKYLLSLNKILGELEIVNVINKKLTIKDMREIKERMMKIRKICLDQNINAELHIYAGKTSEEILLAADDYKASIIIMGGDNRNRIIEKLMRNSSCKVVRKSNFPVLIIP